MITQSDKATAAWQATERVLDAVVTIDKTDYKTTDLVSIEYDSGGYTGDTFGIGSNYENGVTIKFAHLVEGLKQGMQVLPKIGIETADGYEYSSLGVFLISDEITMDRNNDETTIKCYDRMCMLEGSYVSKLSYPAKVLDVIAEIANMSGVPVNSADLGHLSLLADLPGAITGQTYRNAIGLIAQFYAGFTTFDRDGKLTIRTVAEPDYVLDPSQYEQGGLTKNEAPYMIGGIQVEVTTTSSDSTGESSDTTSTLQAGSSSGSQIKLTNNLMTQDRLDVIWSALKNINFYPFSLNWFGNPAIEAGDWLTLQDTKGNKFNVPNNSYTMTFDGSLSAVSKADQTSTSSSSYTYTGQLLQTIAEVKARHTATGNNVYGTDTTTPPTNAKFNDLWYKQNGNAVEMWTYERQEDGTGKWVLTVSDATGAEVREKVAAAELEAQTAITNANQAVAAANGVVETAGFAKDTALKAQTDASSAMANAVQALNATSGLVDKVTTNSADIENDTKSIALKANQTVVDSLAGRVTTAESSLKVMNDQVSQSVSRSELTSQLNGYATQSWTQGQITTSADAIKSTVSSVQTQVDNSAVGINLLRFAGTFDDAWAYSTSGFSSIMDSGFNDKYVHYSENVPPSIDDVICQQTLKLDPSTWYTASFYARGNGGNGQVGHITFYLYPYVSDTDPQDNHTEIELTGDFQRYVITFKTPADLSGNKTFLIRNDMALGNQALYLDLWRPKLEKGRFATDFSTNPTDTATVVALSSVEQTVKGIQTTVSDPTNGLIAKQTLLAGQFTSVIGGMSNENLIPFSGYWQDLTGWTLMSWGAKDRNLNLVKHSFYHNGVDNTIAVGTAQNGTAATGSSRFHIEQNTTYTFSFSGFASSNVIGVNVYLLSRLYGETKDYVTVHNLFNNLKMSPSGINRYSVTFTTGAGEDEGYIRLDNIGSNNGVSSGAYFAELKLELGDRATPYTRNSTSEFVQTESNMAMRVTKDGVVNAVNVSSEGIQIYGNKLHITATTYIDDAIIKSAMIESITADKIKVGTLNGDLVNVINLNANNITSGKISGANLAINLDSGLVEFQSGRIHSLSNNIDINIDAGYVSVANGNTKVMLKNGEMQFVQPGFFDTSSTPYLDITNVSGGQSFEGATFKGQKYAVLTNADNAVGGIFDVPVGVESFSGISTGYGTGLLTTGWHMTKVGGANRGVVISGGNATSFNQLMKVSPYIVVGASNPADYSTSGMYGTNIVMNCDYLYNFSSWVHTTSESPNLYVASDGAIVRSTSASKYKTNITRSFSTDYAEKLLGVPTAFWIDKASLQRYNNDSTQPKPGLNYGMIAEDLAAAGLEHLVVRNQQGGLEGIQYDRIAVALLPLIKQQQDEINELKEKLGA
ncbi:hypothetical protein LFAB_05295 [Lactiplantibacillus fabifermentans T30PCM01]|uniref:Peptidase S74 domain-containing protein n=1 Tax=Lactiplantibacillus fabifermentans T30PCM01 TaxID=1400520 RepID=W6TA32_9LACO|nr:gp58-like family protein [Lactiplantibacillus fabifermentans]ETY74763.1 hypothetical protein LFAB_05295 [Lactiplantibacillus fabifermentans T30PCM01]